MRTMEENRLSSGIAVEAVSESVEELIAHLSEQSKRTEQLIRDHIDRHPGWKQQRELLDTIPGLGESTAAALLAEVPDIKAVQERPAGGGLRRAGAARAAVGQHLNRPQTM
jgi:transposase